MVIAPRGRRTSLTVILLALLAALVLTPTGPASAAPGDPSTPGNEGGSQTLAQVLEESNSKWVEAKAALEAAKKQQAELTTQVTQVQTELEPLLAQVGSIASAAYRAGGMRTASALLASGSPDDFLARASTINTIARYNDRAIGRLTKLQKELADKKAKIDQLVVEVQTQTDIMGKKKADTEKALAAAGGKAMGFVAATSPLATPAPRNSDGSWPKESCIIDDPTTTGCITARTLHAMQQAQSAGFKRFVSCFRPSGPYEHPKGRACDFSAEAKGFGGIASGDDYVYGSNLAVYFVRNADALGVLYVIWFRQVWTASAGWHHYSGVCGDPSCDHTNHVHLSVY